MRFDVVALVEMTVTTAADEGFVVDFVGVMAFA
jgi:hypothetical protein